MFNVINSFCYSKTSENPLLENIANEHGDYAEMMLLF